MTFGPHEPSGSPGAGRALTKGLETLTQGRVNGHPLYRQSHGALLRLPRMDNSHYALLAVLRSWQVIKFTYVCKAALFTYDFALTIVSEADLVWPSGVGCAEALFYSVRYSAWPETCAELLLWFGTLNEEHCEWVGEYLTVSYLLGMLLSQAVVMLRTWAIWNGSRSFKVFFALIWSALAAACIYLDVEWMKHTRLQAARDLLPGLSRGCVFIAPYRPVWIGWMLFCFNDLVLLGLTLVKYKQNFRHGAPRGPRLTAALYRDAFFYFSFMLALALANLIVSLVAARHYQILLYGLERILYTTLACRIILNLRVAAQRPERTLDNVSTNALLEFDRRDEMEMDEL